MKKNQIIRSQYHTAVPKKYQVDANKWIPTVVDTLLKNNGKMSECDLFTFLITMKHAQTDGILSEHPSIMVRNGYVCFHPFWQVSNQSELLHMLQIHFPRAFNKTDLYGLYKHIYADIDELIFTGKCILLDKSTFSICSAPVSALHLDRAIVDKWNRFNKS